MQITIRGRTYTFGGKPDSSGPTPFGYKNGWFVVRASDPQVVANMLQSPNLKKANWQTGIEAAYGSENIFIAPPIQGWVAIVGAWALGETQDMVEIVKRLSTFFGEAQGFATHRVVEYHHWIKAEQGRLLRAYAYLGERGEVQMDEGEPTEIEKAVMVPSGRESDEWYADEQDVMKIAAAWSYDPTELSESSGPPDYGFITGKPTLASKK